MKELLVEAELHPNHAIVLCAAEAGYKLRAATKLGTTIASGWRGADVVAEVELLLSEPCGIVGPVREEILRGLATMKSMRYGEKIRRQTAFVNEYVRPVQIAFGIKPRAGAPANSPLRTFLFTLLYLSRAAGCAVVSADRLHTLAMGFGFAQPYPLNDFGEPRRGLWNAEVSKAARIQFDPAQHHLAPPEAAALAHVVSELVVLHKRPVPSAADVVRFVIETQLERPRPCFVGDVTATV